MNYLASVTFIFHDRHWPKKFILASLVQSLVVVLIGWIAMDGWSLEIFRRAADDADEKLPGWQHWRTYLHDGFAYFGVGMIWMLVETLLDTIVGWPSWVTSISSSILSVGALIILVRTGSFRRAVNPVNAWKALKAYGGQGLIVIAVISTANRLLGMGGANMLISGLRSHLWKDVAIPLLFMIFLEPWIAAIVYNLYGRLYRQSGATV